jgi:hypothetical protein
MGSLKLLPMLLLCSAAPAVTLRYWVEPCKGPERICHKGDPELAEWAFHAWQSAAAGEITFEKSADREKAHIRVFWSGGRDGLYGEARPIVVDGLRGAEVYVLPPPEEMGDGDVLLRDAIVYLTCLHETGHALGLPHTAEFADIMYSFQLGGDIAEYFGRYRRLLLTRADIEKHAGMSDADRKRIVARFR